MKRRRRLMRLTAVLGNLSVIVLFFLVLFLVMVDRTREVTLDDLAAGSIDLLKPALEPVQAAGRGLMSAGRWSARNATWVGDIATWLTGFFTFAAFYLAWRIFKQGQYTTKRAQASQVAVWMNLEERAARTVPLPDIDFRVTRNLKVTYTVHVANNSASAIMGLKVWVHPYSEEEAKEANRHGPSYYKLNVLEWINQGVAYDFTDRNSGRFGPPILQPGEVASTKIVLRVDLEFCHAHIYFWDAHNVGWSKDIKTGDLTSIEGPPDVVDADARARYREITDEPNESSVSGGTYLG